MNKNELKESFKKIVNEKVPQDISEITENISRQFRQKLINKSSLQIVWESVMESKITKYVAAAAILIIAAFVGAEIFSNSGNQQINNQQVVKTAEKTINTESQNVNEGELKNIEKMYAAGDIDGLMKVLDNGSYEAKVAAANFLAKIGDERAIDRLNHAGKQWQGDAKENPFTAAVDAINSRAGKNSEVIITGVKNNQSPQPLANQPDISAKTETQSNQSSVADNGKVDLKIHLAKGDSHETRIVQTQNITQTINGQEQKVKEIVEMIFGFDCLNVDANSNMDVEMAYKSMKLTVDGPMGHLELDSANPTKFENNEPALQQMMNVVSAIAGSKFQMKITPTGKTLEVHGMKEMSEKVRSQISGGVTPEMNKMMSNIFDEKKVKEMSGNMFGSFPDEPVAIGDSWYDTMSMDIFVPIDIDITYMLKDRKDGIAYIDQIAKIDIGDNSKPISTDPNNKVFMQFAGTMNCTHEIDEKTGLNRKGNMTMNLSGIMKIDASQRNPQPKIIPMKIEGNAVSELIK